MRPSGRAALGCRRPFARRGELRQQLLQVRDRFLADIGMVERVIEQRAEAAFAQHLAGAGPADDEARLRVTLVALAEAALEHLDGAEPACGGEAGRHFTPEAD